MRTPNAPDEPRDRSPDSAPARVLVMESDVFAAQRIRRLLSEPAISVIGVVSTVGRALDLIAAHAVDVLVLPTRFAGSHDGVAMAACIRSRTDVAVVFLAATVRERRRASGAEFPFPVECVPKRSRALALQDAVGRALKLRHHERDLRTARDRYAASLAGVADGVVTTDATGQVCFMNPAAEALTLWKSRDALGRPVGEVVRLVNEATSAPVESPVLQALQTGTRAVSDRPALQLSRDGSAVPTEYDATVVRDPSGAVIGVVTILRDVRRRRHTEDTLRRAERELWRAQKVETIGRLTGGLAHDVHNVLSLIATESSAVLRRNDIDGDTARSLRQVLDATDRGTALARQLLAFGRRQPRDPRRVSLNELLRTCEPMVQRLLGPRIVLRLLLDETAPRIRVDSNQIEMVLFNLVANARAAMPTGGDLTISTRAIAFDWASPDRPPEMPPGLYALLSVSDTGPGLDSARMATLFEPFAGSATSEETVSVSLAGVHAGVKQSGGFVYVDDRSHRGTRFALYFPAKEKRRRHPGRN